jgi:hypothetical protein
MMVSANEFHAANKRALQRKAKAVRAVSAKYDRRIGMVVVQLSSGLYLQFKPRDIQGMEHARPSDLAEILISPSGLGLYVPALDADVYVSSRPVRPGDAGQFALLVPQFGHATSRILIGRNRSAKCLQRKLTSVQCAAVVDGGYRQSYSRSLAPSCRWVGRQALARRVAQRGTAAVELSQNGLRFASDCFAAVRTRCPDPKRA